MTTSRGWGRATDVLVEAMGLLAVDVETFIFHGKRINKGAIYIDLSLKTL